MHNSAQQISQDLRVAISQGRNSKGWNQEQFAKMIEVPKADLNSWEAGKAKPPGNIIAKMEKALGIKLPRPAKN
jgi:ribosome-binding protein aMBF1 (putative translation factor)